jgi:peroxiredoxin
VQCEWRKLPFMAAPDFTLIDQANTPWTLSDHRGKAVVLLFLRGDW